MTKMMTDLHRYCKLTFLSSLWDTSLKVMVKMCRYSLVLFSSLWDIISKMRTKVFRYNLKTTLLKVLKVCWLS